MGLGLMKANNKKYWRLFTPPRPTVWAWGYPSVVRWSKPIMERCIAIANLEKALLSISPCQTIYRENPASVNNSIHLAMNQHCGAWYCASLYSACPIRWLMLRKPHKKPRRPWTIKLHDLRGKNALTIGRGQLFFHFNCQKHRAALTLY